MFNKVNTLKKLFSLLSKKQKNYYLLYILLLFIASFLQVVGIGSIIPLTSAFFEEDANSNIINNLREIFKLDGTNDFIIILIFTTSTIIFSNVVFLFSAFFSTKINFLVEQNIRQELFKFYLKGNFANFFKTDKSLLMNLIITETQRLSGQVLMPLADILSRIVILLFLIILLFFLVPLNILLFIGLLMLFYIFLFYLIKEKINKNNKILSKKNQHLIKITNDVSNSFREIKIYGLENKFLNKIFEVISNIQKIKFFSTFISISPRFILEILIFSVIFIYFITLGENFDEKYLSLLAVLGYSFFKILPTIQGVFTQTVVYNSHKNSVNEIFNKLENSKLHNKNYLDEKSFFKKNETIKNIKLSNIEFSFESKKIFQNLNLEISRGEKIGIVGPTGSGKSTLINILLGILKSNSGKISINDQNINSDNLLNEMKNFVAIIPQTASVLEDTISNNIILGDIYDQKKLDEILEKSLVSKFVDNKNLSINDNIHGSTQNLSGGQIQRILIARALYKQPKVLIIDEGFNQLDNETEKQILDRILEIKDLIIIFVYHNFLRKDILDKVYTIKDFKLMKLEK